MKNPRLFFRRSHFNRLKSFRTSAAVILPTLMLMVAVATTVATAQTFSVLYNFGSNSGDARQPDGLLAQGLDGNLYSTTTSGGTLGLGTVFKSTPTGTLSVLHNYDGAHGGYPIGGLTLGASGNFYGAFYGGTRSFCAGVDRVTSSGRVTVFPYCDAGHPNAPPIYGRSGDSYGTMAQGGQFGDGTVYKMTRAGEFTTLYDFDGVHGNFPVGGLVQANDGSFYGTTSTGGADDGGTLFRITSRGNLTVLHTFRYFTQPRGPLVEGSDRNLYGVTKQGGNQNVGMVFKITPSGVFTVLHDFDYPGTDGYYPAGLVQASDGNFYGTTEFGGTMDYGTVYRLSPGGSYSVLYNFDGTTGANPEASLLQHTNGILYGHTSGGGTWGFGTFYNLDVGLKPFVGLRLTVGKVGRSIDILGQGFTGTTGVSFNGTSATFTAVSDTYLTATVPEGATTGYVTVTTPGGTLTSNHPFRVEPGILGFTPASGPVGTLVTITGNSLTQTRKVTFGGVTAPTFTLDSDTQVTATLPAGAVSGKIAITTTTGRTFSPGDFTVTP